MGLGMFRLKPHHTYLLLTLVFLLGQTETTTAQEISKILSSLMMPLVTIMLLILVPILIFRAVVRGILERID